jgi:hypothetical protein
MSSTLAQAPVKSNLRLFFQLRKMITNHIDLLDASSRLGVTPSTLRKILAGAPISRFIQRKIGQVLEGRGSALPGSPRRSQVERLLEVYHLYQEHGTLQRVADEIGLSRERVRQLLVKGSECGLFEYKPSWEVGLPREKILEDYRRVLTLKGVAQVNQMSLCRLHRLLKVHGITEPELEAIWFKEKKAICIERYNRIVQEMGHHPTTTEMQRVSSNRYLTTQIRRLWGAIEAFRSDRGIPPPAKRSRRWDGARRDLA